MIIVAKENSQIF